MRRLILPGVVLFAAAKMVVAAPDMGPSHVFEGKDIFNLQWVEDPQIRPDGRAIAYVRMSYDIMSDRPRSSLWLVDTQSGLQTPIATGPGSHVSPRWSPDGKRLAYVSSSEGGHSQIFVRWMQTGEAARITDLTQAPGSLAWAPDGRSIAFIMQVPEEEPRLGAAPEKPEGATWAEPLTVITDVTYRIDGAGYLSPGYWHAFVVSADGGSPRQLTFGPYNEDGPISWAADSRSVLLSGNHKDNWRLDMVTSQIFRVAVADEVVMTLVDRAGPYHGAQIAPDGSKIAYLGYDDRQLGYQNMRLYIMDRDGNNSRSLTESLDRSVDSMHWAADSRSLYIRYVDKGVVKVARLSLNGRLEPVAEGLAGGELDRPYTIGGQFTVASNNAVAFTSGDPTHPADLALTRDGHVTRLTRLNDELFTQKKLGAVKPLSVSSSFDKRPIDAWMVLPPTYAAGEKHPLILEIHGGPFASYGPVPPMTSCMRRPGTSWCMPIRAARPLTVRSSAT
jgi:dipeptidyl aminopeptidase/acylaminoacyl peptidase